MQPPRKALAFLRWFCREDYLEEIEGDLIEVFGREVENSPRKAKWNFFWSVLKYFRPGFIKSFSNSIQFHPMGMYKSYFKIGWRNLVKDKTYSVVNIVGLSLGFTCFMLIILYVNDETSFDKFHANATQLYRVVSERNGEHKISRQGFPVGPTFKNELAGVQNYVRGIKKDAIMKLGNEVVHETIYYYDKDFFTVFSFSLLHGNSSSALNEINSIVLTREKAEKYFGNEDVVGKELSIKIDSIFESFVVTGVTESVPQNSSLQFDFILSMDRYEKLSSSNTTNWMSFNVNTFVLLHEGVSPQQVESQIPFIVDKYIGDKISEMRKITGTKTPLVYSLQNIQDIHLDTSFTDRITNIKTSNPVYSYILFGIAIFVLLISCINFVNINIGLSFKRAKEIGIRKVVGGLKNHLILQFISEAFLLCSLAFLLALLLVKFSLPVFNQLSSKQLSLSYFYSDPAIIMSFTMLLLITSGAAGAYPAFFVSRFKPVNILYSKLQLTGRNVFSKYLMILQFGLTIFLIIITIIFQSQFNLLVKKDLGYDFTNLIQVALPSDESTEVFRNELLKNKSIHDVIFRSGGLYIDGAQANGKDIGTAIKRIDENYLSVLDIPVLQGRNFNGNILSDKTESVIVNEAFAKEIGWDDPVGEHISLGDSKKVLIVGLVKDYHFQALHEKIMPLVLHCGSKSQATDESLIKISPDDIPQTLEFIQETFKKIYPFYPLQYSFVDQLNAAEYKNEQKWKEIISNASALSILISCLGLFGLTSLSIVRRTKEIGIRKVLGASSGAITLLLLKDFVLMVIIAFLLSIPFAWYSASKWLENFPYHISIEWWIFLIAGFAAILIAALTVSFQAIKVSLMNPVKSLKSE